MTKICAPDLLGLFSGDGTPSLPQEPPPPRNILAAAIDEELQRKPFTFEDLRIETKDSEDAPARIVTFVPNAVQVLYLDLLVPRWRQGDYRMRSKREILLKARQFGFSTLIAALFFLDTINNSNRHTVVIAYDQKGTEALFRMVDRFYNHLDPERRPATRFANTRMLYWPSLDSSYEVLTAGTKASGRGSTIGNLHMSEVAFWQYPEVVTGLLQAVPSGGNVFMETTANGEGNLFHEEYQAAKKGESTFEDRFFAWWMHGEYRREPPTDFEPTTADTERDDPRAFERFGNETEIMRQYGLDLAQIYWRRCKITEPGMGAKFVQEYPANDIEAFRVSGSKFFTEFDEELHGVWPTPISPNAEYIGAFDWGYGAPACFLLGTPDAYGVVITDEIYMAGKTNAEMAAAVADLLRERGIYDRRITILADDGMWQKKGRQEDGIGKADVEAFWAAGLNFVKANKNRRHGWANMRQYLHDVHIVDGKRIPALRIFRGRCPNLLRTIPLMVHDSRPNNAEDLDTKLEDHAVDTCRYLLNSRPRTPEEDEDQPIMHVGGVAVRSQKDLPFALQDEGPQEVYYDPS